MRSELSNRWQCIAGVAALGLCLAVCVHGADVEIVKQGSIKTALSLKGMRVDAQAGSKTFLQVLEADLKRAGWFEIATGGASVEVSGLCRGSDGRLSGQFSVVNTITGKTLLSQSLRATAAEARQLAHRTADAIVRAVKGVPGIASTQIVMVGARVGRQDLYLCDADGGRLRRATHDGAVCLSPTWGQGASEILYTSFHNGYPDAYRIDLAGGRRTRLATYPGLNSGAVLSPDGRRIAITLSKDGNPDLYVKDLKSGVLSRITRTPYAAEASPSWSPDGKQLVFVSDRSGRPQLYVQAVHGKTAKRLTYEGRENAAPDWASDGRIAYSSRRGGVYEICLYDPVSRRHSQLTDGSADWEDPSWAPDSRHIVCTRTAGYRSHLSILDVLGDPPLRLTSSEGDWYSPDWSSQ